MARPAPLFSVKLLPETRTTARFLDGMLGKNGRIARAQQLAERLAADKLVRGMGLAGRRDDPFREAVQDGVSIEQVRDGNRRGTAVLVEAKEVELERLVAHRVLIDIKPKSTARPAIWVLAGRNPWPLDMLLYEPTEREADIVALRFSDEEIERVRLRHRSERGAYEAELKRTGISKFRRPDDPLRRSAVLDLVQVQVRDEMLMGDDATQLFRPALKGVVRSIPAFHKEVRDALFDPMDKQLSRMKPRDDGRRGALKDIETFQKEVSP